MNQENKIKFIYRIPPAVRPNRYIQRRPLKINLTTLRFSENTKKSIWKSIADRLADSLTLMRLFLALALIWMGLDDGQAVLGKDIWLLVMAWSTDMVDGRISRALKTNSKTWLGRNDVYVDMFVSLAVLCYMTVTGLLPVNFLVIYLLVWSAIFLKWGIPPVLAQVFQNPIYAYLVFMTVRSAPSVLPWLLLWSAIALIFFWRRLFELLRDGVKTVFGY